MLIQGALANVGGRASSDELLSYLTTNLSNTDFFKLTPPEGAIMGAAFDWRGVLHDTAAIITLGTVLWGAYTHFIVPIINSEPEPSAGLFIEIKDSNGKSFQFMLGKDYKDKEIFIHEFHSKIKHMVTTQSSVNAITEIEELEKSAYWVKVK